MITSLRIIGEAVLQKTAEENKISIDDPKTFLISQVRAQDEIDEIVRLIFSLKERRVKFDRLRATEERKKEYLWIGNVIGVAPQNRLTTNNVKYLVSETISNILRELQTKSAKSKKVQEFRDILNNIRSRFFIKDGKRFLLNPETVELNSKKQKEEEKGKKKVEEKRF